MCVYSSTLENVDLSESILKEGFPLIVPEGSSDKVPLAHNFYAGWFAV